MKAAAVRQRVRVFSPAALLQARLASGRRQTEIAGAIGRHPDTLADYEKGRLSPPVDVAAAIARFLGVDVMVFFPFEE